MEEAAKQAVRQLGTSTTAALTNMPTSAQQTYDQRVSVITPAVEGEEVPADRTGDYYFDEVRDRMRADMRFSRTSAAITPQVFSDVLHDREAAEYTRFSQPRNRSLRPSLRLAPQDRMRWILGQAQGRGIRVRPIDFDPFSSFPDVLRRARERAGADPAVL